jgi:hypothetical protein
MLSDLLHDLDSDGWIDLVLLRRSSGAERIRGAADRQGLEAANRPS